MKDQQWETFEKVMPTDPLVRRMKVTGGWLYQVQDEERSSKNFICWGSLVFVPGAS